MAEIANPQQSFTFGDVFSKLTDSAIKVGSGYLDLKGQEFLAEQRLDAQARLNQYSAVNPSLGAVNPASALQSSKQSLAQQFLPGGLPLVGTSSNVAGSGAPVGGSNLGKWAIIAVVVLGLVWLARKAFK